jgi:flagellar biosynthetic protein FlhB
MPPETDTGQERPIPATPRRRQEARRKGQVAKSREVNSALMLMAALAALGLLGPRLLQGIADTFGMFFTMPNNLDLGLENAMTILLLTLQRVFVLLAPFLLAMVGVALVSNLMQVGVLFSSDSLMPEAERIDPIQGLKRLFSMRSLMELLKSLMNIGVIGYVCYYTLRQSIPGLATLADRGVNEVFYYLGDVGFRIGLRAGFVLLVIAVLDYAFQRYEFEQSIKMTPEEFKREMREMEGDPMIRARVRSIQREMAQRRMMEAVPEAEVVVTNPTEYAVALKYESGSMAAPVVVAKGRRLVAQKIRDLAQRHGIPIVEDPPLARALYKQVEIGRAIPETLYRAVAEILAYVYRLQKKGKRMAASMA